MLLIELNEQFSIKSKRSFKTYLFHAFFYFCLCHNILSPHVSYIYGFHMHLLLPEQMQKQQKGEYQWY